MVPVNSTVDSTVLTKSRKVFCHKLHDTLLPRKKCFILFIIPKVFTFFPVRTVQ